MAGSLSAIPAEWKIALRACGLREPYRHARPLTGGCIHQAFALDAADATIFVKIQTEGPADQFRCEREGLEALSRAGSSLRIPKVLGMHAPGRGFTILALEYLPPALPVSAQTWENLGRGLAELHRFSNSRFGFDGDNYLGSTPQENGWMEDWAAFFAERRIGALLRRLDQAGILSDADRKVYDPLLEKIPALLVHHPAASLLHGDLWSGNFLAAAAGPALIDPAVYFGDREAEWAIMRLFGGFPESVFAAYQETWALPKDWKDRLPLYQLYHLLNHQLLFGGGYGNQALGIAKRYL